MSPGARGNGSGKFDVVQSDMGGWVRIFFGSPNLPDAPGVYLSQALADWFRLRPHLHLRCVAPINLEGTTVELHAWYEAHLFPMIQGPQPDKPRKGKPQ